MPSKVCPKCKVEKPLVMSVARGQPLIGFTKFEFKKKGGICRKCRRKHGQQFKEKHGMLPNHYYKKKVMKRDPVEYLKEMTRLSIKKSFRKGGFSKKSRTAEIIGCSWDKLEKHLTENGKIDRSSQEYHIDHIIPISLAQNEEEITALWHYKNMRLLPASENMLKGNKLPSIFELNPGIPDLAFQVYMRSV